MPLARLRRVSAVALLASLGACHLVVGVDDAVFSMEGGGGTTSCADQLHNGSETDVDCGGDCAPCASGKLCNEADDCDSGVCSGRCCEQSCPSGETCDAAGACIMCGWAAPATGSVCPAACSSCDMATGTCVILCDEVQGCSDTDISCPPGFACEVRCGATKACADAIVHCPDAHGCDLICTGTMACNATTLTCSDGPCQLSCGMGNKTCEETVVSCGSNACAATCTNEASPTVNCGPSCDCDPC